MNREEIIRMARAAGCKPFRSPEHWDDVQVFATPDVLERFAALVAAAEREACAKVCEEITNELSNGPAAYDVVTAETKQDSTAIWQAIGKPFVEAIRARGNT